MNIRNEIQIKTLLNSFNEFYFEANFADHYDCTKVYPDWVSSLMALYHTKFSKTELLNRKHFFTIKRIYLVVSKHFKARV